MKKIRRKLIMTIILFLIMFISTNVKAQDNISEISENSIEENVLEEENDSLEIEMEYKYNEKNNTVTAIMHSNQILKATKKTWKLSADGLTYTSKEMTTNGSYYTEVEDINGNKKQILIEINLIDEIPPKIEMEYKYNEEDNTVTAIMHSNEILRNTKKSWELSEDGLTYTSEKMTTNGSYYTEIEDIYENRTKVLINIQLIDDKKPEIELEYLYDTNKNTEIVVMHSNERLKNTKKTWELSKDGLTYTSKEMTTNGSYYTEVEDMWGNKTRVKIEITQIDDKPPQISLTYEYNKEDDSIVVTMNSNEELGDTKPTWSLSQDKKSYTKVFKENQEYSTPVEDRYGNQVWIKIKIYTKLFTYEHSKGPNITVKYLYDSSERVTVYIISDRKMKNTKPTWKLSEDGYIYTKTFTSNNSYTTNVIDVGGNEVNVSIIVNFFKDTLKGIDVSEFQKIIDWQRVKRTGIDFAIIRVGYRGWGSGRLVTDMFFDNNIKEATKAGIDIGIYFFTQATTEQEAKEEAKYTINLLSKYNVPVKYPIAIDTEKTPPGNGRGDKILKEQRTKIVQAFCQEIEKSGYKSMIYGNKNWLLNDLEIEKLSKYDIWLADYITTTNYQYPYTIWQYTSGGNVSGIGGVVDMNIGYKRY